MRRNEGKVEPTSTGEIAGLGMEPVNKIHKSSVSNVITYMYERNHIKISKYYYTHILFFY